MHDAIELADYVCSDNEVIRLYINFKIAQAKNWIARPDRWAQIEAVAAALLERKTLSEKEVRDVCREAILAR
jgi:hypothetical protein